MSTRTDTYDAFRSSPIRVWEQLPASSLEGLVAKLPLEKKSVEVEQLRNALTLASRVAHECDRESFDALIENGTVPLLALTPDETEVVEGGFTFLPSILGGASLALWNHNFRAALQIWG